MLLQQQDAVDEAVNTCYRRLRVRVIFDGRHLSVLWPLVYSDYFTNIQNVSPTGEQKGLASTRGPKGQGPSRNWALIF